MDLFEKCAQAVEFESGLRQSGHYCFFRRLESPQDAEVVVNGKRVIMIGSNNYLGLTNHPRVKEAAIKAIEKYGTGCAGSRFLNGNLEIHEELEKKLAKFLRKEAALVFATGYQTNLGVISALVERNDAAIIDMSDHASIVDGCRLSFGEVRKYRHNDMDALERALEGTRGKDKLIVVDGVFSMEGDIADLPAIVKLAKAHGARIMLDDAHAVGVLGEGRTGNGGAFRPGKRSRSDHGNPQQSPCRDRRLYRRAIRCDQLDQTRFPLDDLQRQSPPLPGGIGERRSGHH